jgi:hypothetical protein
MNVPLKKFLAKTEKITAKTEKFLAFSEFLKLCLAPASPS